MSELAKAYVQIVPSADGIKGSLSKVLNDEASSAGKSAGSVVGTAMSTGLKVAGVAVGAASAAVAGFAKESVSAGMNFDSAMSQVAATMGLTTDEIADLRDFAQEMGSTTAFSATEAAEALNYMALAGYDTETSMSMLPSVLDLAAAGQMDLARASDMVTDTQTAFGISLERTSLMVDEMAKAASTGNTSVEQLGDAFLVVGGLAQELNGGFVQVSEGVGTYVDGTQELEIALTAMANAGIKGSEAGTHMRNMLLKLSSPTDEGTQALERMGVSVFDTAGSMRSLSEVFGDLNGVMGEMTQEEKISTISALFNTRDIAAAEALLNAVSQDWNEIGASILDAKIPLEDINAAIDASGIEWSKYSDEINDITIDKMAADIRTDLTTLGMDAAETAKAIADGYGINMNDALMAVSSVNDALQEATGAAQQMADTQLENLAGDITLFQSALEGAEIAVSDQLTPTLRDFVSFGTRSLSTLTDAFKEGGLSGAMEALGTILSEGLNMVISKLPDMVSAGMELLGALGQGLLDNLPVIIDAAVQIITQLVQGLVQALPQLVEGGLQIILGLATGIAEMLPELIPTIVEVVLQIVSTLLDNIDLLVDAAIQLMLGLVEGLGAAIPVLIAKAPEIIMSLVGALLENIPQILSLGFDLIVALGTGIAEACPGITQAITEWLTGIAEFFSEIWDSIKEAVSSIIEGVKQKIDTTLQAIYGVVSTILGTIQAVFSSIFNAISGVVSTVFGAINSAISTALNAIKTTVDTILNSVKSTFTTVFNGIKTFLSPIIEWLKGIFNFEWKLPQIKLPHFSLSGEFSLAPPSVPSFSIDWYDKAMDNAMILNGATIFGRAGDTLLGGGESGAEVVAGARTLMDMIRSATSQTGNTVNMGGVTINVEARDGQQAREIAEEVNLILARQVNESMAVFA